jgi:hypothetical protein
MTPNTDRLNNIVKRQVNARLRDPNATYDQLNAAWRALVETVRAEQEIKEKLS